MFAIDWLAPYARWQTWMVIAGNMLPLFGIVALDWDASTLVILYWMETAIIGLWVMLRILVGEPASDPAAKRTFVPAARLVMAAFLTVHASIFMAVHLIFLTVLAPGRWTQHLQSPLAFVLDFVIPSGAWIPLAGLFAVRAIITVDDIRNGRPASRLIGGFYGRIVLMQLVIIASGFLSAAAGSPVLLLVLIVVAKTAVEIYWDSLGAIASASVSRTPPY